jgi:uncharacterized protein YjeT (DUF2065 family)
MAPQVGFEPTTDRLTADCSTTELLRNSKELIPSTNSTFVIIICLTLFVNTLFYFFYFAPNKSTKANQMLDQLLRLSDNDFFIFQSQFLLKILS